MFVRHLNSKVCILKQDRRKSIPPSAVVIQMLKITDMVLTSGVSALSREGSEKV